MSRLPVSPPHTVPGWIAALVLLSLLGNGVTSAALGILPDEAYYWVWSQRLELSYFDHPPLIAWLMWPFTVLLGNEVWVVRLPAALSWLVGALLGYHMAQRLFGGFAGALAVLVWSSLPVVQVGFHIATPDSALMLFTWLTVWFAWRAGVAASPRLWLVTGLMAGLALLAKYPAVLLLGGVFLALLSSRSGRQQLLTPWPWLAALLAALLFVPVIIWNAQHDWASFAFQFGHGVKAKATTDHFALFLFFVGGQVAVAMPWTLFAMGWAGARPRLLSLRGAGDGAGDGYSLALLVWSFWLPLLVFGVAGLTSKSGPNWPITAYVTGSVLLAGGLERWLRYQDQWRRGGVVGVTLLVIITLSLVNLMRFPHWLQAVAGEGFTPKRTQLSQNYGWEKLRPELQGLLAGLPPACTILTDNHARAGMVAWLLQQPERVTTSRSARYSQYDLWREEEQGEVCLYLDQYDREFDRFEAIPLTVELPEGRFERVKVVTADNPDLSLRWFVLYRPVAGAVNP